MQKRILSTASKEKNPHNCPQARPVKTLWQILEEKVYAGEWEAKTIDQFGTNNTNKAKRSEYNFCTTHVFVDLKANLKIATDGSYATSACQF